MEKNLKNEIEHGPIGKYENLPNDACLLCFNKKGDPHVIYKSLERYSNDQIDTHLYVMYLCKTCIVKQKLKKIINAAIFGLATVLVLPGISIFFIFQYSSFNRVFLLFKENLMALFVLLLPICIIHFGIRSLCVAFLEIRDFNKNEKTEALARKIAYSFVKNGYIDNWCANMIKDEVRKDIYNMSSHEKVLTS